MSVNEQEIEGLRSLVRSSNQISVLTGAGISTESGIPDFRSPQGIWADDTLMDAMSDSYLLHHAEDFWAKYKFAFLNPDYLYAEPNEAHLALSFLEEQGARVSIFTQNVDGLHQAAGSKRVCELHGNVHYAFCPVCHTRYGLQEILAEPVPMCRRYDIKGADCHYVLHPDTVLFGQEVRNFRTAALTMMSCDLLLVVGSSLTVNPVAQLPAYAKQAGAKVAIVNLEPTSFDNQADVVIRAQAGTVLPRVLMG